MEFSWLFLDMLLKFSFSDSKMFPKGNTSQTTCHSWGNRGDLSFGLFSIHIGGKLAMMAKRL